LLKERSADLQVCLIVVGKISYPHPSLSLTRERERINIPSQEGGEAETELNAPLRVRMTNSPTVKKAIPAP